MKNLLLISIATISIVAIITPKVIAQRTEQQDEASGELSQVVAESLSEADVPFCLSGFNVHDWGGEDSWEVTENGYFETNVDPEDRAALAFPIGLLLGQGTNPSLFFQDSNLSLVKEISLYDQPHSDQSVTAYLHACRGTIIGFGYQINLASPREVVEYPNPNDVFFTGYKGAFANLHYFEEIDGYFNILKNTVDGGYWIKEEDLSGVIIPTSFTEFLTQFRTWSIYGYHNSALRASPTYDSPELVRLDGTSHVLWNFTGEVSGHWAEVIVYEIDTEDNFGLPGCYSDEEVLKQWNGSQWRGWLQMVDDMGHMNRLGYFGSC